MLSINQLHEYQKKVVDYILDNESAFIILGLGLGKTVSALTAIVELKNQFVISNPLIIAPLRVAKHTWPSEAKKWDHLTGLSISTIMGPPATRKRAIEKDADVYVINRENAPWLVKTFGQKWPFDMVVIDESSSFKNSQSKRFKALKKVKSKITRTVLLTGTPAPNSLLELWSQVYLLDAGERLGRTFTAFRAKYFESDYMGYKWTPRPGAEDKIHNSVSDISLSMSTEDYLTLPDKIIRRADLQLNGQAKVYRDFEKEMILELGGQEITAVSAGVLCGKLQQMAQGAIYDENKAVHRIHDIKLDALEDLIEAAGGDNILLAYNFKHDAIRIKERFPQATDVKEPGAIDAWNKGKIPLLMAHPASAGHGLNLQHGGRRVVWFCLNWSLEYWEQFNGRLHRQGQDKPVIIHVLNMRGTIDDDIMAALDSKRTGQQALISAVKTRLAQNVLRI